MKVYLINIDDYFESMLIQTGCDLSGKSSTIDHACFSIPLKKPDIIICDIKISLESSVTRLAQKLDAMHIPIVYVTGSSDENIYNLIKNVSSNFKYLVKPFNKLSLKSILDNLYSESLLISSKNYVRGEYLYIKKKNVFERLKISEISFLHSEGNYTTLNIGSEKYMIKISLSKLLELQKFCLFQRVHRNFAANVKRIQRVDLSRKIISLDSFELPLGRAYTKGVKSFMDLKFAHT